MLQARGALRVSVGPWCWDPIGPSRELKTQALNCLPNRGSSIGEEVLIESKRQETPDADRCR